MVIMAIGNANLGKGLQDISIIKTIAGLVLKGSLTFQSHFVAPEHAFCWRATPRIIQNSRNTIYETQHCVPKYSIHLIRSPSKMNMPQVTIRFLAYLSCNTQILSSKFYRVQAKIDIFIPLNSSPFNYYF